MHRWQDHHPFGMGGRALENDMINHGTGTFIKEPVLASIGDNLVRVASDHLMNLITEQTGSVNDITCLYFAVSALKLVIVRFFLNGGDQTVQF